MKPNADTGGSPTRDALLRHLLGAAARTPTLDRYNSSCLRSINALAKASGAAYSWVHGTVMELADHDWLTVGDRIIVEDVPAIYRWWASHRKAPKAYGFHVADPLTVLQKMDEKEMPLYHYEGENLTRILPMATTYYAENTYGRHLFPRRMDVYFPADLTYQAASQVEDGRFEWRVRRLVLEAGGQLGGRNLRLIPAPYRLVRDERAYRPFEGKDIPVAPLPQVIVDLIQEGGSAGEAADLLMEREYA